jgi:hypothetical protein
VGIAQPQPAHRPLAEQDSAMTISVNVQLPNLRLPKVTLPRPTKSQLLYGALALTTVAVVAGAALTIPKLLDKRGDAAVAGIATEKKGVSFKPLAPADVTTLEPDKSNGQVYVDAKKNTVNFKDTYSQAQITVSQQALPENLKNNPASFKAVLDSFGAKESDAVDTVLGKMYLATKRHNELVQQFAILRTDSALFMMQADKELKPDAWKDYLSTLHTLDIQSTQQ